MFGENVEGVARVHGEQLKKKVAQEDEPLVQCAQALSTNAVGYWHSHSLPLDRPVRRQHIWKRGPSCALEQLHWGDCRQERVDTVHPQVGTRRVVLAATVR